MTRYLRYKTRVGSSWGGYHVFALSLTLSLSFCLFVFLSFCLFVFFVFCLCVFVSLCLSVCLSVVLNFFRSLFIYSFLPLFRYFLLLSFPSMSETTNASARLSKKGMVVDGDYTELAAGQKIWCKIHNTVALLNTWRVTCNRCGCSNWAIV